MSLTETVSAHPIRFAALHGGRMTKYKGVAASIAPYLSVPCLREGSAALAFVVGVAGVSMLGTTALHAGSCLETAPGIFNCSGPVDATDASQTLSSAEPTGLTVTTDPGFGIVTGVGGAFNLSSAPGTTGLRFTDNNSAIIAGTNYGLYATNSGSGELVITSTGSVSAGAGSAVETYGGGGAQTLMLGDVTGYRDGVSAYHYGTGALSISVNGATAGYYGTGIEAGNYGYSSTTITATGPVFGLQQGIYAYNGADTTGLTIQVADVTGHSGGIGAYHYGSGDLSITSTGTVSGISTNTGSVGEGILAYSCNCSGEMTITTNNVNGQFGIAALHYGTDGLQISSSGLISTSRNSANAGAFRSFLEAIVGDYGAGVTAFNAGAGLTVSVHDIRAFGDGIYAYNEAGAMLITSTGSIVAGLEAEVGTRTRDGIEAYNLGSSLTIRAENVSGTDDGIEAQNYGDGALTITTTGTVSGGTAETSAVFASGNGIEAYNSVYGTDLTISADIVNGNDEGIDAHNAGSGSLSISSTGTVQGGVVSGPPPSGYLIGSPNPGEGIQAYNSLNGVDLSISVVDVSGYSHGINAANYGTGTTTIQSTGTVIGGRSHYTNALGQAGVSVSSVGSYYVANAASGIDVYSGTSTTGLSITGKNVHGGLDGIYANHQGGGVLQINSTGSVSGGPGSYLNPAGSGTIAEAFGVAAPGFVSGVGINAVTGTNSTGLSISAKDVSGYGDAIHALHYGSGELSVTTSGAINGGLRTSANGVLPSGISYAPDNTFGNGITAYGSASTSGVTIITGAVTGSGNGIYANTYGTGTLQIESSGAVAGSGGSGVYAAHNGTGAIGIKVGDTSGHYLGVVSSHYGTGDNRIESSGTATGNIVALGAMATNGNVHITSNNATGGLNGIMAIANGVGHTTVESTGTVTGTGVNGVLAVSISGNVNVAVNNVIGGTYGVQTTASGVGSSTSLRVNGTVSSGSGDGVRITAADAGSSATVDLFGSVSGGNGTAINMSSVGGAATLILNDGASLNGDAVTATGDADDILVLAGSTGASLDLSSIGNIAHANGIVGFDTLRKRDSGTWNFSGTQTLGAFTSGVVSGGTVTMDSATMLLNGASMGTLSFASGTTLASNGATRVDGHLSFSGAGSMKDGESGDTLAVAGNFHSTGSFALDLNFSDNSADVLDIGGNVSGSTLIDLNLLNSGSADGTAITVVNFGGTSDAGDFVLAGGPLTFGAFTYDLELDSTNSRWALATAGFNGTGVSYQGLPGALLNGSGSLNGVIKDLSRGGGQQGGATRDNFLSFSTKGESHAAAPWVRIVGGLTNGEETPGGFSYSFENSYAGFQVGADLFHADTQSGQWAFGAFAETKTLSGSARNTVGSGTTSASGLGLGATAVWTGDAGHYFGVLAHVSRLTSDVSSSNGGVLVTGHNSTATTLVASGGYRFALGEGVSVTPNASLTYASLNGGSFTDTAGNTIDMGRNETITARVGAEVQYDMESGATVFAAGHVSQDLSNSNSVRLGNLAINGGSDPTMFELKAGATMPITDAASVFFEGGYGQSFENSASSRESLSLAIGLRATW